MTSVATSFDIAAAIALRTAAEWCAGRWTSSWHSELGFGHALAGRLLRAPGLRGSTGGRKGGASPGGRPLAPVSCRCPATSPQHTIWILDSEPPAGSCRSTGSGFFQTPAPLSPAHDHPLGVRRPCASAIVPRTISAPLLPTFLRVGELLLAARLRLCGYNHNDSIARLGVDRGYRLFKKAGGGRGPV